MIYLIGSLRNPEVPALANELRVHGHDVFDDWYAAGERADDNWREYEQQRGHSYVEALRGYAAEHVFSYDKFHLDRADVGVLLCPAGKSGHLELGYLLGQGKPGYIILPKDGVLPEDWHWLTGIYEGEGSLTRNGKKNGHGMQLTVTMKDRDVVERLLHISQRGNLEGPYIRANPKHSPMWRWAVRKREDILYLLRGMYPLLALRRHEQIQTVLTAAGIAIQSLATGPSPRILRYDVMYKFATGVFTGHHELLEGLAHDRTSKI